MTMLILFLSTIALSTPLILAAMGGLTSERSGIINIGLEGKMLIGAVATALAAAYTGNAYLGLLGGIFASVLFSLLHWLLTQHYRVDHVISGMAINLLALGGSNFIDQAFIKKASGGDIPVLPVLTLDLGDAGKVSISVYLLLAFLIPFLIFLYLRRTRGGLRLLAVGSDPDKARLMGVSPVKIRFWALVATGVFTGLAGAMLVSNVGRFTNEITAGRGFIALAALILGSWRPLWALIACIAFGFFEALQLQLQGSQTFGRIPAEAWQALPYIATIIALAGFLGKSRAPMGLGKQ